MLDIISTAPCTPAFVDMHLFFIMLRASTVQQVQQKRIQKLEYKNRIQELSYRKQIARQLRTQYIDGIHRPKYYIVTLKSRLRVTQGHWKRNHWTDNTRLTISRVI